MSKSIVAIVGSPNVGKSTIFNRILGYRHAIVDDQAGVTRDRIYGDANWLGHEFLLVDTGGIEIKQGSFQDEIRQQVQLAIDEADVIVFICDGNVGLSRDDELVAKMLYKCKKPIILAVNKIDDINLKDNSSEFYRLGFGEPICLSSAHGIGVGDLLDKIVSYLPENSKEEINDAITFSIIGRPNVGKSSLMNALLGEKRVIVSNIEGTTRDSVDTYFQHDGQDFIAIDTAGLKKRGQIYESIDKYAALRALRAIERSEIVLLVIDANEGIKLQDKHVVSYAFEQHKAIIIVVNKWDLIDSKVTNKNDFTKKIKNEFVFLDYAPIVYVSAKNKKNIDSIFTLINDAYIAYHKRIPTNVLNEVIQDAQMMNESPNFNGGRLKIYFANQVDVAPPTIVLFVNNPKFMHFSYQRYILNRLRDSFDFSSTPINIVLRKRT